MSKLPRVSGRQVIAVLLKNGFVVTRQKGSHIMLKNTSGIVRGVVVPNHSELDAGTLLAILRQANLSKDEFMDAL